jgi:prepilin peptidase CpaA
VSLFDAAGQLLFSTTMVFAASTDLFKMKILNCGSLILAAGFLALAVLEGMPVTEIGSRLGAGLCVLAVCFVLFNSGWIGGGDAKLAAATALWLGWGQLYNYLLHASLLGGALSLLVLGFRKRSLPPALANQRWVVQLHDPTGGVPYGIALAGAALLVYPPTQWMCSAG